MILITRPKEQSKNLETILGLKGYKTSLESLYKIKNFKTKISCNKNHYYIFPSIHSVQSLINSKQIKNFQAANILAIGKKVEQALLSAGCKKILLTSIDSDSLVKKINKYNFIDYNFVYLCSNKVNEDFFKNMKKTNIKIKRKVIYETIPSIKFSKKFIKYIKNEKITGAVFYSYLSAKTFIKLCEKYSLVSSYLKNDFQIFCLSNRVAKPFFAKKFKFINIAKKPTESSLVEMLT